MITSKNVFSVLAVIVLFALPALARSYDLKDLTKDVDLTITSTDEDGQCSSINIGNIVDKYNSDLSKELNTRIEKAFKDAFAKYWKDLLLCVVGSIVTSPGGGVSGAKGCIKNIGGDYLEGLQDQYEREFKNDLITDCTVQSDVRDIVNKSRRILAENGRDGGAVYVRNWRDFLSENRYRGLAIARNEMANTNHCAWVRDELQVTQGFKYEDAVPPQSGIEDGQDSYRSDAACPFADDFNPFAEKNQTSEALYQLLGNPAAWNGGSFMLAQDLTRVQIADEVDTGRDAFPGGLGPLYEQGCAILNKDGTCLRDSLITQPAAGVAAEITVDRQALVNLLTNPLTTTQVAKDLQKSLVSTFLSLNQPLAQLQYKQGGRQGPGTPTPTPPPTDVPGSGDEDDPVCTKGMPSCHCAINDNTAQSLATGAVLVATRAAIAQHPEMVTPDGVSVLPGFNIQFLQAVCQSGNLTAAGTCKPNNSGFGLVLSMDPPDINVDVILPTNVIRQPGQVTLVCTDPGHL